MDALTEDARRILDSLEPDRCYELADLRTLAPDAGNEYLLQVMQELWLNRYVERVGYAGWRLHRSTSGHEMPSDANGQESARRARVRRGGTVKPEDLFDHAAFGAFFK